jgi:hypothetical protein
MVTIQNWAMRKSAAISGVVGWCMNMLIPHGSMPDLRRTEIVCQNVLNGVKLVGDSKSRESLLEFKGIIMVEGNDVASGLNSALLSQSVVLMPPPGHTSWLMEELLEPWIHYIPLEEDFPDLESKMQSLWI